LGREVRAEDQARDSFISLVVHELRSPLTAIKGYSQLLLRQAHKLTLPPRIIHSADAIEQQSTRMADLIAEMHDAVRLRRGDLPLHSVRAELLPLVERAIAAQRALYPQHEIALDAPPEPLVGEWDPQRVEQVVGLLVNNAARYMPDGGTIGVRVAREEDGGRAVATIRVRDRGIGVAEADRERIFDYLYRTPETRRRNLAGLGIGLFLSRGLAERMGGRLWLADSRTGDTSGSTFCVALPLAEPPAKTHIWLR
jgi:signal transduction histidine kinase